MKAGTNLLGSPDDAVSEKMAIQNNCAQLTPMTLSLLGFCFDKPKGADDQDTVTVPVCAACRKPFTDWEKKHKHHVSYYPSWTVPVHVSCHRYIHNSDRYPHLKPTDSDTRKYYKHKDLYCQTNRDKIREQGRQYRQTNKNKKKELNHQYYQANKDKIKERDHRYRLANKDKRKEWNRRYRQANNDKERERHRQYRFDNRNKVNEQRQSRRANKAKAQAKQK